MKLLITGICGFAGSSIAEGLLERRAGISIIGVDNLMRPGSELNVSRLRRKLGVTLVHGDIRLASDFESLPGADWVIDAAANPSVLAGTQSGFSSRQLVEHNLASVVNVLEYCKAHRAGFVFLSTSRVYSIDALASLPFCASGGAFHLDEKAALPAGVSAQGIGVDFSTRSPVSLYGSTKLAAEALALEYGAAFEFPVWINRCGVLAGAGQFGTPDQGIFSYWINAHLRRRSLRYIGFDGTGKQTRDVFHPRDLTALLDAQMNTSRADGQRLYCAGGGRSNAISLAGLTAWCDARFGSHAPAADTRPRRYDIPWVIMDSSDAQRDFGWRIEVPMAQVFDEIAQHAGSHPDWLETSAP
ncbi:MAG TPA: NAD-dependent epimerase/dehydratase family protein [Bryobacteraceae bacterium]|nr:NAD-dependent epimerase/dehydratase family protein [Bryobacteraceae bacterium]